MPSLNPTRIYVELTFSEVHGRIVAVASCEPHFKPVFLVTRVLELADRPMRACEIHAAARELHGGPVRWPSVKEALAAYTIGGDHRFRRVAYAIYELAR